MLSVMKAVAHPWLCDVMGHMTTRFYVGMFDDASYHLLREVFGWNGARDADGKRGWVDVRHVIEYQDEVAAGDLLEISATLTKIGGKSITARYEMQNLGKATQAASLEAVYVLFDLESRQSLKIDDALRASAERHLEG